MTFLDKYLITASLRADGSSKFGKGNRWGYFPSASVAWRMEQEEFLKDVDWLNQLKVRLSYGVTGNQSIDPYSTFSMYGSMVIITMVVEVVIRNRFYRLQTCQMTA